ncbi:Negative elongation factor A [Echinococcus multilocularis]|uniref:Negative elongation factor A n=1 Tax=Echinococcus multilocularis TaxID=6211 RepID=A0A068XZX4_ECHMU|nr:Negative elongation factor A [Echinococcus multilocularis]
MADLHKFIRQQFADNNWSKQCDLSKISVTKLREIAEAFNQLDVKSKLTLTFTYTNSVIPSDPEIAELVDSVVLQALVEDNNFVRCVATALHSRQSLNHLIFDLSDTSESFAKTLKDLEDCSTDGHISKIPPLAELLDARITDDALGLSFSSSSSLPRDLRSNCLNSFCGFTIREKTPAQQMKESYLDRLQEECERRRVHVPIPGRSFGKQDGGEDVSQDSVSHHLHSLRSESPLGCRRAPSFPRRSSAVRKTDMNDSQVSAPICSVNTGPSATSTNSNTSARAKLLAMHSRSPAAVSATSAVGGSGNSSSSSGASGNTSRRMMLLSSSTTSEPGERASFRHLNASGASVAGGKRSSGIKLLDFQDLPAIGLQAKKLRKEQQEKEREEKRKEREQKAQERREARDAARRAKMLAHAAASAAAAGGKKTGVALLSPPSHPIQTPVVSQALPLLQPMLQQPPRLQPGPGPVAATAKPIGWDMQQPWTPFGVGPTRNHHRVRQPNRQGGSDQNGGDEVVDDDDEDYEDDDEEECEAVVGADGVFHLTAPRGFRGFTEAIPQNSVSLQSQQSVTPTSTILLQRSTQGDHFVPHLITTGQQAAAQGGVFQAVPGGPRFRFVRPWAPPLQGQAPQKAAAGVEGVTATASTQLVQLPDGRIALATTAPHQISQQQQQQPQPQQQQTVIIANPGTVSRLQMAATPTAQIPTSIPTSTLQAATGSPQQVLIRSPALVSTAPPHHHHHQATVMVNSSLPQATIQVSMGQTVPLVAAPRLQPRLIQIRPRTPVVVTTASTVTSVAPSPAAAPGTIPVILPSLSSSTANITSSSAGFQQRPRFVVANSLRQVAPTSAVHNPPQQQTLMRIVPRPAQAPLAPAATAGAKQLLPQPPQAQPPPLAQPREKIHLTSTQLTSIQTLFQGANRLTRPDKAIILSFFSGKRVNPHPDGGTALRIRLSEYRERVIDATSGKVMDVAAETFMHLDYATGKFECVKSYRTLPPEQLMALPVQPKTTTTTAATTTSAP